MGNGINKGLINIGGYWLTVNNGEEKAPKRISTSVRKGYKIDAAVKKMEMVAKKEKR